MDTNGSCEFIQTIYAGDWAYCEKSSESDMSQVIVVSSICSTLACDKLSLVVFAQN